MPEARDIDDLIGDADAFPVLRRRDYFNHAGAAPMARVVADAVRRFVEHFEHNGVVDADFAGPCKTLRETAAALLNCDANEVALAHNTGEGISHVALGLDLREGDRIVLGESEYPSNQYPWMEAARRTGARVVKVPETVDDDGRAVLREADLLDAAAHPRTRVLAVSHVQWGSGQRMDLTTLGDFCRENGVFFSVDAIQSLGVVPIDVRRDKIDSLQAGGHKWAMGTMGSGVFFVRREMVERVRPAVWGSQSVIEPLKWESIDFTPNDGALRYEYGAPAMASINATAAGLAMLHGVGIDAIFRRVTALGDRFIAGLNDLGLPVVTPANRGGAVCFTAKNGPGDASRRIYETLAKEHDTELAYRCGRVRFSPHFYNTDAQVDRLLERLADVTT